MKYFTIILLLLSFSIFAQEKARTDSGKIVILNPDGTWHYDSTKSINSFFDFNIPEKRKFNHPPFSNFRFGDYYFSEKYDKFENQTTVEVRVKLDIDNPKLFLVVYYNYEGKTKRIPAYITLYFVSQSDDWEYLNNSNLTLLVDNKRIKIGELERDGTVGEGYVLEYLYKSITTKEFLRIINGTLVEGKLFTTVFKLSEEELEAFRDFASRMK